MNTMNTIRYNVNGLLPEVIAFVQTYNSGLAKQDSIDLANDKALSLVSLVVIEAQLTKVLTTSTFLDGSGKESGQAKQTTKISWQRSFARVFPGKALAIKGNTCTIHTLTAGETVNFKGKIITVNTAQEIADKKAADKKAAAERSEKALQAEQAIIRLETTESALKQAESTAALATKAANEAKKIASAQVAKAETAAENLAKQVADLTLELERARHESACTIAEYQALKKSVLAATSLKALKATLTPGMVAVSQPARNLMQATA